MKPCRPSAVPGKPGTYGWVLAAFALPWMRVSPRMRLAPDGKRRPGGRLFPLSVCHLPGACRPCRPSAVPGKPGTYGWVLAAFALPWMRVSPRMRLAPDGKRRPGGRLFPLSVCHLPGACRPCRPSAVPGKPGTYGWVPAAFAPPWMRGSPRMDFHHEKRRPGGCLFSLSVCHLPGRAGLAGRAPCRASPAPTGGLLQPSRFRRCGARPACGFPHMKRGGGGRLFTLSVCHLPVACRSCRPSAVPGKPGTYGGALAAFAFP